MRARKWDWSMILFLKRRLDKLIKKNGIKGGDNFYLLDNSFDINIYGDDVTFTKE